MINAIAKRIANYVCYNTESSDDKLYNYEIYVYGFEIILSSIAVSYTHLTLPTILLV